MNKFLHEPSVRLRAAAANGRGLGVVDAARYLFALERCGRRARRRAADGSASTEDAECRVARSSPAAPASSARTSPIYSLANGYAVDSRRQSLERASAQRSARREVPRARHPLARGGGASCARGSFDVICHLAAQIDVRKSVADPASDASSTSSARSICSRPCAAVAAHATRFVFSSTGGAVYGDLVDAAERRRRAEGSASRRTATAKLSVEHYMAIFRARARARHRRAALSAMSTVRVRIRTARPASSRSSAAASSTDSRSRSSATASRRATTCTWATWRGANLAAATLRFARDGGSTAARSTSARASRRTWCELATLLKEASRARRRELVYAPARPGRAARSAVDVEKAAQVLGWKPKMSLAMVFARLTNGSRRAAPARPHDPRNDLHAGGAVPYRLRRSTWSRQAIAGDEIVLVFLARALARELGDHARRVDRVSSRDEARPRVHRTSSSARRRWMQRRGSTQARRCRTRSRASFTRAVQLLRGDEAAGRCARRRAAPLRGSQVEALQLVLDSESADASAIGSRRFIPWLATIGSVSPLIGLLGTVLGVIDAFVGIATKGSGNLERGRAGCGRGADRDGRGAGASQFRRCSGTTSSRPAESIRQRARGIRHGDHRADGSGGTHLDGCAAARGTSSRSTPTSTSSA